MEERDDVPQNIPEALNGIIELEAEESLCKQFHKLIGIINYLGISQPQNRILCATIKKGMLRQHHAYHMLMEGILNEGLAQGENNAAHAKDSAG